MSLERRKNYIVLLQTWKLWGTVRLKNVLDLLFALLTFPTEKTIKENQCQNPRAQIRSKQASATRTAVNGVLAKSNLDAQLFEFPCVGHINI